MKIFRFCAAFLVFYFATGAFFRAQTSPQQSSEARRVTLAQVLCMLQERHMVIEQMKANKLRQEEAAFKAAAYLFDPDEFFPGPYRESVEDIYEGGGLMRIPNFFSNPLVYDNPYDNKSDRVFDTGVLPTLRERYGNAPEPIRWNCPTELPAYPSESQVAALPFEARMKLVNFVAQKTDELKLLYLNLERVTADNAYKVAFASGPHWDWHYDNFSIPPVRLTRPEDYEAVVLQLGRNLHGLKYINVMPNVKSCFFTYQNEEYGAEPKLFPGGVCPIVRTCSYEDALIPTGIMANDLRCYWMEPQGSSLNYEISYNFEKNYVIELRDWVGIILKNRREYCYDIGNLSGNIYLFCKNSHHPPGRGMYSPVNNNEFPSALDAFTGYRAFPFSVQMNASGPVNFGDPNDNNYLRFDFGRKCAPGYR